MHQFSDTQLWVYASFRHKFEYGWTECFSMNCITTVVAYKLLSVVLLIMIIFWLAHTNTPFFMFLIKNIFFRQLSSLWINWVHNIKDYPDPNMHIFKWIWKTDVMPKVCFSVKKLLSIWTSWIFETVSIFWIVSAYIPVCTFTYPIYELYMTWLAQSVPGT